MRALISKLARYINERPAAILAGNQANTLCQAYKENSIVMMKLPSAHLNDIR